MIATPTVVFQILKLTVAYSRNGVYHIYYNLEHLLPFCRYLITKGYRTLNLLAHLRILHHLGGQKFISQPLESIHEKQFVWLRLTVVSSPGSGEDEGAIISYKHRKI